MEIISPTYSFIKFDAPEAENNCCDGDEVFCIPVIKDNDIVFQFIISGDNLTEGNTIFDTVPENIQLILLGGSDNTPATVAANTLRNWTIDDTLSFEKNRTAANQVTYLWRNIFKDILTLIDCDECFQLAIKATIGDADPLVSISNCLIRKCDECFTSVLEYYNDEDYAEFMYCNVENAINRVRLPLFLRQPQFPEERSVYIKSRGAIKLLKSRLSKEYEVETEHFPEHIHEKIMVLLAHDNVQVASGAYTGGISKSGEYKPEWTDNLCKAPVSFKATATPYAIRNNNCADCEDVDLSVCTPVDFSGDPLPDAIKGIPYNATIQLTGTQPFVITASVIPAWMNVNLTDDTITLSGTPDTEATDIAVEFTITNCTDASSYNFADTIDVTKECAPVIIDKTALTAIVIGVPYNHDIPLAGDAPFTLDVLSKPAWMTIAVSGSNINLSGTPTDIGTVDIIFNVSNCLGNGTDSGVFSLTINPPSMAIDGTITNGGRNITINVTQSIPYDVDFILDGIYDNGGTPTAFTVLITLLAGTTNITKINAAPDVITCITPSSVGTTTFIYSVVILGTSYDYTLEIADPC
ncbi:MAG: hypothetical protein JWO92_2550 [Chitinophagaceae bacterium]|nr:hypothetical protein [Chitinophagaceae bacterium]